jgi:hypothetical protein
VVVTEIATSDSDVYVAELVFPDMTFRLSRAGWAHSQAYDADHLAKRIGKFLGMPVETRAPLYCQLLLQEGILPDGRASQGRREGGYKVAPKAIK